MQIRHRRNITLLSLTIVFSIVLDSPLKTSACSVTSAPSDPSLAFDYADAVFEGTLTVVNDLYKTEPRNRVEEWFWTLPQIGPRLKAAAKKQDSMLRQQTAKHYFQESIAMDFQVHKSWKGVASGRVHIYTGGICGKVLNPGRYLIYAHYAAKDKSAYGIHIGSRVVPIGQAKADLAVLTTKPRLRKQPTLPVFLAILVLAIPLSRMIASKRSQGRKLDQHDAQSGLLEQ